MKAKRMKTLLLRVLLALATLVVLIGAVVAYNYMRHFAIRAPHESVEFVSADGVRLRGTLFKPSEEGVFPAVAVLHGSGRDHTGDISYRVMIKATLRGGVAVLLYDKRGVGKSGGDFESALYRDFVADGIAAIRYLASRPDVDAARIGLHASSEGGWLAPEVAYTTGQVAFIFNRVGSPLSWRDTVISETRNDLLSAGVAEEDLEPLLAITRRRWNYHIAAAANPSLAEGPERDAINAELERLLAAIPEAESQVPVELPPYDREMYDAWAADIAYDPRPFLESIDVPMIYTFGENDINVPTAEAVAFLETLRKDRGKDIEIVVFEGVGHALVTWKGIFTAGYVPKYLDTIESWYREITAR